MSGSVTLPLLRLPNAVLFPGVYLLLHVGHSDLRKVIQLAEENEGYLCVALPAADQNGLHLTGCLAQVVERQKQRQGENVRLVGLSRMKLRLALDTDRGPMVEGEALQDNRPEVEHWDELLDQLEGLVEGLDFPAQVKTGRKKMPEQIWLDSIAFYLPLGPDYRQRLLQELKPLKRVQILLSWLSQLVATKKPDKKRQQALN